MGVQIPASEGYIKSRAYFFDGESPCESAGRSKTLTLEKFYCTGRVNILGICPLQSRQTNKANVELVDSRDVSGAFLPHLLRR